ncbi:MAG: hypothetical protein KBS98_03680 [Flavobacterium sp.]|nr:hypothetical protein [Candidatus Neoflavobacterium equi]
MKTKFLLFILLFIQVMQGQTAKKTHDFLKELLMEVYENPQLAIQGTAKIIEDPKTIHADKIQAYIIRSDAFVSMRNYKEAQLALTEALGLITTQKFSLIKVLNKNAVLYYQLHLYDKALQVLNEADKEIEGVDKTTDVLLIMANNNVLKGFIYREQLDEAIAVDFFNKAIKQYTALGTKSSHLNSSIVYYNLGNSHVLLGDLALSKNYYQQAIVLAQKYGAKSLMAYPLKGLANVLTLEGNFTNAMDTLKKALQLSDGVGDVILDRELFKLMSDNYLALGDYDAYIDYKTKHQNAIYQVKSSELSTISNELLELHKKSKLQQEALKKQYMTWMGVLCLLGLSLIIGYIFYHRKIKKNIISLQVQEN